MALIAAGLSGWRIYGERAPQLAAGQHGAFEDSDGDLIPDAVEWVLMTDPASADSDADGVDDFLEATRFEVTSSGAQNAPTDHEMRFAVSAVSGQVLMNLLMRVVPGEDVEAVVPFVEFNGARLPIADLFWNHLVHVELLRHPTEGLYVFASSWLCSTEQIKPILPCAIGVVGTVGGRDFLNGSSLLEIDGVLACVVPMPFAQASRFAIHPVDGQEPLAPSGGGSFWQRSKACEMELKPVGGGGGTSVTQVQDAHCKGAPTMACAPSCGESAGRIIVVPNGLPFLKGN